MRAVLALLAAAARVSCLDASTPKLAQFSGDVRAAALRGDELSGVRPYTVRTPDGSQENVYVLALEGDELSKARRRWGFQGRHVATAARDESLGE